MKKKQSTHISVARCALCGSAPVWRSVHPVYEPLNGGTHVNSYDPSWVCPNCSLESMPDQRAVLAIDRRDPDGHTKLWNETQKKLAETYESEI